MKILILVMFIFCLSTVAVAETEKQQALRVFSSAEMAHESMNLEQIKADINNLIAEKRATVGPIWLSAFDLAAKSYVDTIDKMKSADKIVRFEKALLKNLRISVLKGDEQQLSATNKVMDSSLPPAFAVVEGTGALVADGVRAPFKAYRNSQIKKMEVTLSFLLDFKSFTPDELNSK